MNGHHITYQINDNWHALNSTEYIVFNVQGNDFIGSIINKS